MMVYDGWLVVDILVGCRTVVLAACVSHDMVSGQIGKQLANMLEHRTWRAQRLWNYLLWLAGLASKKLALFAAQIKATRRNSSSINVVSQLVGWAAPNKVVVRVALPDFFACKLKRSVVFADSSVHHA